MIVDADEYGDEIFLDSSGFDTPSRLLWGHAGDEVVEIKSAPAFFDASDIEVAQHFVASADGTMIPYFVVGHRGSSGPGKTLLGGYGGFENSNTPGLRRRARPAVAGPRRHLRAGQHPRRRRVRTAWHTQAMREGRHLVVRGLRRRRKRISSTAASPRSTQLGAQGGSNGGLLMGIMLTKYPELFGALVCSVPLLDMKRYHLLLAGASWVAEYGDPDNPDDWAFISEYSPYQNILGGAPLPCPC